MDDCVFCKIIEGKINAEKVYEDDKFIAFLDARPINPGHTLLIPKQHANYIFDIEEPQYSEIFQMAKKLASPIKKAMSSRRVGLAIEGFGVPHVHIHLVPINDVEELDPNRAKKTTQEELSKILALIRSAM